jgi:hypothetical protein
MSETKTTSLITLPPSNVAIVATPAQSPTLEVRALQIRGAHDEVATAVLTVVERALDAGVHLLAAKDEVGYGRFEAYVATAASPCEVLRTTCVWLGKKKS